MLLDVLRGGGLVGVAEDAGDAAVAHAVVLHGVQAGVAGVAADLVAQGAGVLVPAVLNDLANQNFRLKTSLPVPVVLVVPADLGALHDLVHVGLQGLEGLLDVEDPQAEVVLGHLVPLQVGGVVGHEVALVARDVFARVPLLAKSFVNTFLSKSKQ